MANATLRYQEFRIRKKKEERRKFLPNLPNLPYLPTPTYWNPAFTIAWGSRKLRPSIITAWFINFAIFP
jgi:hypothetical protein